MRSLAPRTREAEAALSAVRAPAAAVVKVRRLILEGTGRSSGRGSAFVAHRFAEVAGLALHVGRAGRVHLGDQAVDLAAPPFELRLALVLRHVTIRHRTLLESGSR